MFVPNGGVIWWVTFILGEKKILPTEWLQLLVDECDVRTQTARIGNIF